MKFYGVMDNKPWIRLPPELHGSLISLPPPLPEEQIAKSMMDNAIYSDLLLRLPKKYAMIRYRESTLGEEGHPCTFFTWTEFGQAVRLFALRYNSRASVRRSQISFSEFLSKMPAQIVADLKDDPRSLSTGVGAFFQDVGVLLFYQGGRFLTNFGERALAAYAEGVGDDNMDIMPLSHIFTGSVKSYLRQALVRDSQGGVTVLDERGLPRIDGREIKAYTPEISGVLIDNEIPYDVGRNVNRVKYAHKISPDMKQFVSIVTQQSAVHFYELYKAMPREDQIGFMSGFRAGSAKRAIIWHKLGWLRRAHGSVKWAYTSAGERRMKQIAEYEAEEEKTAADMTLRDTSHIDYEPTLDDLEELDARLTALEEQVGVEPPQTDPFDLFNADPLDTYVKLTGNDYRQEIEDDPFDIL